MRSGPKVIVIGGGIGGLTTAATLAKQGIDVTVLEAHVYAGGCAGTFYHQGYRFDAGATLAGGFYPGGPMDLVAQAAGVTHWPSHTSDPAMAVHLADGTQVLRWSDPVARWDAYRTAFGQPGEQFFTWQERTADALWDLALRTPPWPPQSPVELAGLVEKGVRWLGADLRHLSPLLWADAFRPVAAHLHDAPHPLRQFVDAQLLIAAQTTSARANALYGASALDLPRRGIVHLEGGIGAIAATLVAAIRAHGGEVLMRQSVAQILATNGRITGVETKRNRRFDADIVIANLPPWNIAQLMGSDAPPKLRSLDEQPKDGWGAFTVYLGLDASTQSAQTLSTLHHQVVVREPLGEGNSVFVSLSPEWDRQRAPTGRRAVTLSTHTGLAPWWTLFRDDRRRYELRKQAYTERLIRAAEQALPGLSTKLDLVLPGTPVTFRRFTQRHLGWVGGFPQVNLWRTWSPRLAPGLWMVGDSIFPGQSTAAVALGGMRVAAGVVRELGSRTHRTHTAGRFAAEGSSGD
jgi:C-3',4' desaturase CrtD